MIDPVDRILRADARRVDLDPEPQADAWWQPEDLVILALLAVVVVVAILLP